MEDVELKINEYGTKFYYIKGTDILHREDGPAIEFSNGSKEWFQHGKNHRLNGPAIEWVDGYKEYWINDKYIPNVNSIEEAIIKSLLE